jgi:hypothetical protein
MVLYLKFFTLLKNIAENLYGILEKNDGVDVIFCQKGYFVEKSRKVYELAAVLDNQLSCDYFEGFSVGSKLTFFI